MIQIADDCFLAGNPMPLFRLVKKGLLGDSKEVIEQFLTHPNLEIYRLYRKHISLPILYSHGLNGHMHFIDQLLDQKIVNKNFFDPILEDAAIANFFHANISFVEPSENYCLSEIGAYLIPFLQQQQYPITLLANYHKCLLNNRDDFTLKQRLEETWPEYPLFFITEENALGLKIGSSRFFVKEISECVVTYETDSSTSDLNDFSFHFPYSPSFFFDFTLYLPIVLTCLSRQKILRANIATQIPIAISFIQHYLESNREFFVSCSKQYEECDKFIKVISSITLLCKNYLQPQATDVAKVE